MNFPQYVQNRLKQGNFRSLLFFGEGGIGKTSALKALHKEIIDSKVMIAGKRVAPFFIPMNALSQNKFSSKFKIHEYIRQLPYIKSAFERLQNEDPSYDDVQINKDLDEEFDRTGSSYHYLLLCDGLNELPAKQRAIVLDELKELIEKRNVTVCLTTRRKEELSKGFFGNDDNYVEAELLDMEIVDKKIRDCNANPDAMSPSLKSILRNPFYLHTWETIASDGKRVAQNDYNKGKLLYAYLKNWAVDKCLKLNKGVVFSSADGYGENVSYADALNGALLFLEALSLKMNEKNTFYVSLDDCHASEKTEWAETMKFFPTEFQKLLPHANDMVDAKALFTRFFIPLGFFENVESSEDIDSEVFFFRHQIYRDFLASQNVVEISHDENWKLDTNIQCSCVDVLDFFANNAFVKPSLITVMENGASDEPKVKFCEQSIDFLDSLGLNKTELNDGQVVLENPSNISVLGFLIENQLELLKNGSVVKEKYCDKVLEIGEDFIPLLRHHLITKGISDFDVSIYDTVRVIAEIYRRVKKYDESISLLAELIGWIEQYNQVVEPQNRFTTYKAENGIQKCHLFKLFDSARTSNSFQENLLPKYAEVLTALQKLAEEDHYTPSSNVYSMLLATPDRTSEPYVDRVMSEKGISQEGRVLKGFILYWHAVCHNFEVSKDKYGRPTEIMSRYPLRQVLSMLINQTVSFDRNPIVMKLNDYESMMSKLRHKDNANFNTENELVPIPYDKNLDAQNNHVIDILLAYLESRNIPEDSSPLKVRLLIRRNASEEALLREIAKCSNDFISRYVSSALDENNDGSDLIKLKNMIVTRCQHRTPDSYDGMYMQRELREYWKIICKNYPRQHSKQFTDANEDLLTSELP